MVTRAGRNPAFAPIMLLAALAMCSSWHSPAHAQGPVQYVGTVRNHSSSTPTASLTLSVLSRSDSSLEAYVNIGPPLFGSGAASGWFNKDSLTIVSASTEGDTIQWSTARIGTHLSGEYKVTGGSRFGQEGSWSLELARGTAIAAPGAQPAGSISSLSKDFFWWLSLLAVLVGTTWGVWQIVQRTPPRAVERTFPVFGPDAPLKGVGGWMAWFLFGQAVTVLFAIATLGPVLRSFTNGSWELGLIVPALQPLLVIEAIAHVAQMILPVIIVILTVRLDQRARPLWLLYLALLFLYGIVDIGGASRLPEQISLVAGAAAGNKVVAAQRGAHTTNLRLLLFSAIWFLYWYRSRRVRLNFGPASPAKKTEPLLASA